MSHPIPKEWMNESDRFSSVYMNGVDYFVNFAKDNNVDKLTTTTCPCKICKNGYRVAFKDLKEHLIVNGIDPVYRFWSFHGERLPTDPKVGKGENQNDSVEGLGMGSFVDASYGIYEGANNDFYRCDGGPTEDLEEPYFPEPDLPKRYKEYKRKAEEKLYPSCEGPETTLSAIVELHNLKTQYGWSGSSMTALLSVLKRWLPKGNTLPEKYPVMKEMLKNLGMKAKCIHACVNNCILYWKDNEAATECSKCKEPRYRVKVGKSGKNESKEPRKVLRHFPLIPRLKRFYTIPWIARDMTWHHRATPSRDYMRHPIDSAQWKTCKSKWPNFSKEWRNVWLAVATDGFNPRGIQSTSYSCWPVITVTYNLPPSLCMKSEFQMLSLLIPGPKAPGQNIDVFFEPLLDEFDKLWEGVTAFEMDRMEIFTLRGILMWGIHDFPAYGNLSGAVTHGYKACPCCGDETPSIRLPGGRKIIYTNFRMFLEIDHPFRHGKYLGLRTVENRLPPQRLTGAKLLQKLSHVNYIAGKIPKGSKRLRVDVNESDDDDDDDDVDNDADEVTEAWYRKSILFKLDYWGDHKVRHVIDVMHVEKNVSEHILDTLFGKKEKTKGLKNPGKPNASFILDKEERRHFVKILKDMKLPSGFSSNLSNIVTLEPPGFLTMKSHDHHVILEYLLPVLLQHAFPRHCDLRRALHQISLFFSLLCSKVLIRQEIQDAKYMVAEALCVLEKHFSPSFFDISIHLVVHLADEALICGPTPCRWMFPFERSMKECKNIPSNKRYVEGSISEAYLVSESMRYAMEYMPNSREGKGRFTHEAVAEDDWMYNDEGPVLDGKIVTLSSEQFTQIRRWVLFRLDVERRDDYYSEYRESLQSISRGKRNVIPPTEVKVQTSFISWLFKKLLDEKATNTELWQLVQGPNFQATTYKKYRVNGYVFSTRSHDDTVCTQDSGVCMKAITSCVVSRKDKNPVDASIMWYGVIKEIIELDYRDFSHVVLYCDWVRVEDKTNGCKLCPDSNLVMVNFNRLKSTEKQIDEPVILASEADQVFYSKDLKNPDWWVVIHSPRRLTREVDSLDEPKNFQSILGYQTNLRRLMERLR